MVSGTRRAPPDAPARRPFFVGGGCPKRLLWWVCARSESTLIFPAGGKNRGGFLDTFGPSPPRVSKQFDTHGGYKVLRRELHSFRAKKGGAHPAHCLGHRTRPPRRARAPTFFSQGRLPPDPRGPREKGKQTKFPQPG